MTATDQPVQKLELNTIQDHSHINLSYSTINVTNSQPGDVQVINKDSSTFGNSVLMSNNVKLDRKIPNSNGSNEVMEGRVNPGFEDTRITVINDCKKTRSGEERLAWTGDIGRNVNLKLDDKSDIALKNCATSNSTPEQKKESQRDVKGSKVTLSQWVVLAAGCYNGFVVLGLPFSLGVLYVELISYYNASRTEVALVQAICVGLLYGGGILVGFISKIIGVRRTLFFGSLLASAGLFASWLATSPFYVIISVGVVTGFGSCMGFVPLVSVVASTFKTKSSIAIATIMTSGGVGSLVIPKLFALLVDIFSWKGAMLILCCLYLNVAVCGLIVTSPVISTIQNTEKPVTETDDKKSSWRVLLKPLYCTYILASMIAFGSMNGVTFTLVDFAEGKGLTLDSGINLLLALNASNTVTRFLTGFIKMIPKLHTFHIFTIAVVLSATSVFTLVYVSGFPLMLTFCVLFGFGLGILIAIFPVGIFGLSGQKMYPFALGIGTTGNGIANTLAGITVGVLYDLTGSYQLPFQIFCGTALSAVFLLLVVFAVVTRRGSHKFYLPQPAEGEDQDGTSWQKFMYL